MGRVENQYTRQIAELTEQKDNAYAERDQLVALVAKMAVALGHTAGLAKHDPNDKDWDEDWRNIVMIDLPTGQVSWHIHDSELPLFEALPAYKKPWDGHTTEEKYDRVRRSQFERDEDDIDEDDELIG